jgi:hypothetical protein
VTIFEDAYCSSFAGGDFVKAVDKLVDKQHAND